MSTRVHALPALPALCSLLSLLFATLVILPILARSSRSSHSYGKLAGELCAQVSDDRKNKLSHAMSSILLLWMHVPLLFVLFLQQVLCTGAPIIVVQTPLHTLYSPTRTIITLIPRQPSFMIMRYYDTPF